MHRLFLGTAALALAVLFQTGAYAQLEGNVAADIPFTFHVAKKALPAGNYTIRELGNENIEVRNDKTGDVALEVAVPRETIDRAKRTELVFHRYGKDEYLREVVVAGDTNGVQFPPTEAEQRMLDGGQHAKKHSRPAVYHKTTNPS